jgi:hypothetical protein
MKRYLLPILFLFLALPAMAQTKRLVWNDPNAAGVVDHYQIYKSMDPAGPWETWNQSTVPEFPIPDSGMQPGIHYFVVTCLTASGVESEHSNVTDPGLEVKPLPMEQLRIVAVEYDSEGRIIGVKFLTPEEFRQVA